MNNKRYGQFCALAYALDVVGERWSLLIIRELLTGPRRFKDLMGGLPGISANLLSERLKFLEQQGILKRRVLPPPAGSTVYELTPFGQGLEKAVIELGRWGARLLPVSLDQCGLPGVGTAGLAIKSFFHPEQALGVNAVYHIDFGNEVLQVQVQDGQLHVRQGETLRADAVFHTDMKSYMSLFSGQLPSEQAIELGLVRVEGDPAALHQFLQLFGVQGESRARDESGVATL